jgi:hypothetical protein
MSERNMTRQPKDLGFSLGPGQVLERSKPRSNPTRDERILAAIRSNRWFQAEREIAEAEELGFSDLHLLALIGQPEAAITVRSNVWQALKAHYDKKKASHERDD